MAGLQEAVDYERCTLKDGCRVSKWNDKGEHTIYFRNKSEDGTGSRRPWLGDMA